MHFRLFQPFCLVWKEADDYSGERILNGYPEQVWYVRKILLCNRSDGLCSLFEDAPEQRSYGLTSNEGTRKKTQYSDDVLKR